MYALSYRPGIASFDECVEQCCMALCEELQAFNRHTEERVHAQLHKAVNNLAAHIYYQFLDSHGPQQKRVTHDNPLVPRYVSSGLVP